MKSLQELNERDVAFRDRRTDPYRAPEPPGPIERGIEGALPWISRAIFGVIFAGLAALVIAALLQLRLPTFSPGSEQRFLNRLEMSVRCYEFDYDALPPAEPVGSAALTKALASPSPSGQRHLFVEPGMLDAQGNLLTPEGRIVHYGRWNAGTRWGFVLWAGDVRGTCTGATTSTR